MKLRAGLGLLALVACTRPPPLEELERSGVQALRHGDLETARARAEAGRHRAEMSEDAAWRRRFDVLRAEVLVEDWRLPEALEILDAVLESSGPADLIQARARMARGLALCSTRGSAETMREAEAELRKAARLARSLPAPELTGQVALRRGTCAVLADDYAAAEASFRAALAEARAHTDTFLEARATGNLGFLRVRIGRYDEAADWFTKALDLGSAVRAQMVVIRALTNLGYCYYALGNIDRALGFLTRAETLATSGKHDAERLYALQIIGNAHYRLRQLDVAREHYREALGLAREIGDQYVAGELLSNLAIVELEQADYDAAEVSVREALRIKARLDNFRGRQHSLLAEGLIWAGRGNHAKAETLYREVLASPHSSRELLWEARASLAGLRVETNRPAEAEEEFAKAFAMMEASRDELRKTEHKISFFSSLGRFYDDYVEFLVAGGEVRRALDVADRSRARRLLEIVEGQGEASRFGVGRFEAAARALDAVILFYWLAPSRSFLWSVTPRNVRLHELPGEDEIRKHVEIHQSLVLRSRDPLAEASAAGEWLYRTLVAPAEDSLPAGSRVVFVPDGPLYRVNPETLVVPASEPHYWIEDVTLLTAPSVSVLAADQRPGPRGPEARGILMIGDPLPVGDEFPRLPNASRELARISEQFAPSERAVYSGERAQPSTYRESNPRRFSLIHFATHAQANREVPLDSAVILSSEGESFKLYAREIVDVPVRADLVTLSACRTAGSRTFAGEGLVGLTWAFMSSGARNVVAGLWNVEDASTSELMGDLYKGIRQGHRPEEALRQAKLRLLRSRTAYHKPFYWAPFMIYTSSLGHGRRQAGPS